MLAVFQQAGFEAASVRYEDGVVQRRRFPIEPDRGRARRRLTSGSSAASRASIGRLLAPSLGRRRRREPRRAGKIGHAVFQQPAGRAASRARSTRSTRRPRHVAGVRAYRRSSTIPDDVDLAVLAVPADEVAGRGRGLRAEAGAAAWS